MTWTDLTSVIHGVGPSPRGATKIAVLDETLYFFGGFDQNGGSYLFFELSLLKQAAHDGPCRKLF